MDLRAQSDPADQPTLDPGELTAAECFPDSAERSQESASAGCPVQAFRLPESQPIGGRLSPLFTIAGRLLQGLSAKSQIPEHKRPPLLSSTPWFGPTASIRHHPYDLLSEGTQHCGPVFRFEIFGKTANAVSGPLALHLAKNSEALGLDRKSIFEPFFRVTGVPIFSLEGEEHELLRRLVRFGYTRGTIAPFVGRISETVRETVAGWPTDLTLLPHMSDVAIRAISAAVSPQQLPIDWTEMGETGELGMMVTVRQRSRFVLKLPRMKRAKRNTLAAIDPIIRQHREGLTKDDPLPWMIDAFIAAEADGQTMDDAGIRGGVTYALIAAYIYLGRQSLFMLIEALRDPRTLAALNKEVDTAFAKGTLTAETLRMMPTLRALFVEANRRYPLLPGMPYETTRPTDVGEYILGANELVVLTGVPGHFDGKNYGCPWSFDQQRVRPPRREHRASGAFAPWGFPPRSCLAIGLCELVTTTIVATILHELDITIANKSASIPITVAPLVGPSDGQPASVRRRGDDDRTIDPSSLYEENLQIVEQEDDAELPELVSKNFQAGETIFQPGDPAAEFFIIVDGHVNVSVNSRDSDQWQVNVYGPGQGFGEIGILKQTPRRETARAVDSLDVLMIDRKTFLDLVAEHDEDAMHLTLRIKNRFVSKSLRRCLDGLRDGDLPQLKDITFDRIDAGKLILREGDPPDSAYIIVSGKVDVFCSKGADEVFLSELTVGDIFGEIGVLEDRPRTASARATESTVLARLSRETLQGLLEQSRAAAAGLRLLMARHMIHTVERLRD